MLIRLIELMPKMYSQLDTAAALDRENGPNKNYSKAVYETFQKMITALWILEAVPGKDAKEGKKSLNRYYSDLTQKRKEGENDKDIND